MSKDKIRYDILRDIERLVRGMARLEKVSPLLNITEEAVLRLVGGSQVLSIKEIRTTLKINADNLSHILRSLENYYYPDGKKKVSLVKRKTDPYDIRRKLVFVTRNGKKTFEENSKRRERRLGILFHLLSEKELKTFSSLLKKMIRGMEEEA